MNRRLYRSRTDVVWTGVAGGVAEWLNMDPSLVRVLWVILTVLSGGLGLLVYVVMWIVVPETPREPWAGAPAAPWSPASGSGTDAAATAAEPGTPEAGPPPDVSGTPTWTTPAATARREPGNAGVLVGIGLIVLGVLFLAQQLIPRFDWDVVWPAALIILGAVLILGAATRRS